MQSGQHYPHSDWIQVTSTLAWYSGGLAPSSDQVGYCILYHHVHYGNGCALDQKPVILVGVLSFVPNSEEQCRHTLGAHNGDKIEGLACMHPPSDHHLLPLSRHWSRPKKAKGQSSTVVVVYWIFSRFFMYSWRCNFNWLDVFRMTSFLMPKDWIKREKQIL